MPCVLQKDDNPGGQQHRQQEDLGQHYLTERGIRCEIQFQP